MSFMVEQDGFSLTSKQQVNILIRHNSKFYQFLSAFYRVNYEDQLWLEVEKGLESENFDGIDVISRTLIVDDVFNLARARQLSYNTAFDVLSYLEREVEYYPWHAAFTNFNFLRRRIGQDAVLEPFLTVKITIYNQII